MKLEKRKRSVKQRVFSFFYRILHAMVAFFVKVKVIRKRKVEKVVVE